MHTISYTITATYQGHRITLSTDSLVSAHVAAQGIAKQWHVESQVWSGARVIHTHPAE